MMANKAFYKPTDGGASRSVTRKDSRSKLRICVCLSEGQLSVPFVLGGVQWNPTATGFPGKWCHVEGSALVSAFGILGGGSDKQVSFHERTCMLSIP